MIRHPFLTVLGAEVITAGLIVVGWNVWQHHRDNHGRIVERLRVAARL
jgi:hypothetical protein